MAAEDRSHVLPLEAFSVSAVPLTTHSIAWSPDAELAIAADDCVFLYLPEFPSAGTTSSGVFRTDFETQRQYHEVTLRFPTSELRRPELNEPLFNAVRQDFPDFESSHGAGASVVANVGSSMNHVVAIEWSPNGLGRMRRSVLAVLTGSGTLNIYCEGLPDGIDTAKLKKRNIRTIKSWVVAWGVGGDLLVPRAKGHDSSYSKEYITSFAWAGDIEGRGALLSYQNDEDEIVILSVQSEHSPTGDEDDPGKWRVEEIARFVAEGSHPKGDPTDPDYSPSGSSFALRWSPWLKKAGPRTAIISYVAKNYVGFRQVSITGSWRHMDTPKVTAQSKDCSGVCLYLGPDAFVTWEDLVWTIGDSKICRGLIATPAKVQSFQVAFDNQSSPDDITPHSTDHCDTTYPPEDEIDQESNPITGLIIHPPSLAQSTPSPYFSLVRLSATPNNSSWYQSNLPLPPNPEDPNSKPRWAAEIAKLTETMQPLSQAIRPVNPDGLDGSDDGSGYDEIEDMYDDDEDDGDSDEEFDKAEFLSQMQQDPDDVKIHTTRVRILGMTSSPGGGATAVFVTPCSALRSERLVFSGMRCKVLFGQNIAPVDEGLAATKRLSTEGGMWEWMYGGGPPVPGVGSPESENGAERDSRHRAVKEKFSVVAAAQTCVFCAAALQSKGKSSRCAQGHAFHNCAATGIPILAPGVSNTCGVCGCKCLKPEHLMEVASDLIPVIKKEISSELCGGCGGKFIN